MKLNKMTAMSQKARDRAIGQSVEKMYDEIFTRNAPASPSDAAEIAAKNIMKRVRRARKVI